MSFVRRYRGIESRGDGSPLKTKYDFSTGIRGRFFRKNAELNLPIYVSSAMHARLERIAKRKRKPVAELVNQLLKKDVELLEGLV